MSPLEPSNILDSSVDWRSKLASWIVQQGVSTVLLLAIVAGVYVGRTDVIVQIQKGYAENAASLEKAVSSMDKQFDRVASQAEKREQLFDRVASQAEKREQLLIEVLRANGVQPPKRPNDDK